MAMLLSAYTQVGTDTSVLSLRPNACGELFSFTLALDATMLISKDSLINRINPLLAGNYERSLVFLLLLSVGLMIYSGRTQCRIRNKSRSKPYPVLAVAFCWILGITIMSVHLYLLLGG